MFRQFSILLTFSFFAIGKLSAASLSDAPSFSLSPNELAEEANRSAANTAAPVVVLLDDEHWVFRDNGDILRQQHYVFKVLSAAAVKNWSGIQQRWEPWHERRPEIRARVITAAGIAHELDPQTLVDASAAQNAPQTYSDLHVLQGPLPAIEVGSIVEEEITQITTPVLGSFVYRGYLVGQVPVRFSRMRIQYPESLPFRYQAQMCPNLKQTKTAHDGRIDMTLTFGSFEPVDWIDPLLPFDAERLPSILLSTGSSWNDLAAKYQGIVEKQIADAPLKDFVAKVVGKDTDRLVVIRKLVRALHSEIRYTGVEFADAAIVPAKPADVLARKYGDCKDKASLLVAMLRVAGIPADIALLNAGLEQDVSPDHPGMGMFNHAIVYVPGPPIIWIDATAEHMEVGSIPSLDQGRLALIAHTTTKELIRIPNAPSSSNVASTTREIYLPDFGPARIAQTISGLGEVDNIYRNLFSLLDNPKAREALQKQTQAEWNTEQPVALAYPPVNDFAQPFRVDINIAAAKAITVSESDARVTIPALAVFEGFPAYFATDDSKDENQKARKPRSQGFVIPVALTGKISYRVHMPDGFELRKLPEDQKIALGPATYYSRYQVSGQIITADLIFDSGKRAYTLEEGLALKKALLEFAAKPRPVLEMQPRGQALLDSGKLREGLDAYRDLAAKEPSKAINRIRLSRAYLSVNLGEQAREEAKVAAGMEPELIAVWRNLAFVNEHDLIGRKFNHGWDSVAAESALRKAMALDPKDLSIPLELATTFEYDEFGEHYNSLPRLEQAVRILSDLGDGKLEEQGSGDMLLYDLAYLGHIEDLNARMNKIGSKTGQMVARLVVGVLTSGSEKALADLQNSPASTSERADTAGSAYHVLVRLGAYSEAADALALWSRGRENNSWSIAQVDAIRRMRRFEGSKLRPDSPEHLIQVMAAVGIDPNGSREKFKSLLAAQADQKAFLQTFDERDTAFRGLLKWFPPQAALDSVLSSQKLAVDRNGDSGFRVKVSGSDRVASFYVVQDAGQFKFLGSSFAPQGVARRILAEINSGKIEVARRWLDWLREEQKLRSEDDPLGGDPFPHLWKRGENAGSDKIRIVAATLLRDASQVATIEEAIGNASDPMTQAFYRIALLQNCEAANRWAGCAVHARALYDAFPDSHTARHFVALAYSKAGRGPEAEQLFLADLKNNPDDLSARRALEDLYVNERKLNEALQTAKQAAQNSDATIADWNQYGWISLAVGQTSPDALKGLQRAQNQPPPPVQHTIAAMYADLGMLNEARQISLQALQQGGYREVPPEWYFVFGRIAEYLGATPAAIGFYSKTGQYRTNTDGPLATSELALQRMSKLKKPQR